MGKVKRMRSRLFFAFAAATVALSAHAQYSGARPTPRQWKPGFDSITIPQAQKLLHVLAGPDFRGRNSYNGDFNLAAGWVMSYLQNLGLKPMGDDGSYFQRYTLVRGQATPEGTTLKAGGLTIPFSGEFSVSGVPGTYETPKVVFLHSPGDLVPTSSPDSFKGKWIILSQASVENSKLREYLAPLRTAWDGKTRIVTPVNRDNDRTPSTPRFTTVKGALDPASGPFPNFTLSHQAAVKLAQALGASKFSAAGNQVTIEETNQTFSIDIKANVEELPMVNILAGIEGSDPKLRSEAVMYGSHLDHMGPQREGILFGADDNGSGCTANMLIARAMVTNPVKPKRTVLFAFWNLEESGLYGSFAYVNFPKWPLKDTIAYINMDMLGRDEEYPRFNEKPEWNTKAIYPGIVETNSPDFLALLTEMNQYVQLRLKRDHEDRTFRTDTGNFVRNSIPTVKAFTGEHKDYHRAGDTPEKINYEKLTNAAKWLYLTGQELAARPTKPKFERRPFVAEPAPTGPPN